MNKQLEVFMTELETAQSEFALHNGIIRHSQTGLCPICHLALLKAYSHSSPYEDLSTDILYANVVLASKELKLSTTNRRTIVVTADDRTHDEYYSKELYARLLKLTV